MAWVSPTGHNDPIGTWANETNAYDEDIETYARDTVGADSWGNYLELTHAALNCDKVQFRASYQAGQIIEISLDVYYESAWHNIYEGIYADGGEDGEWVEKTIPAGTKSVTAARAKFYNDFSATRWPRLYEFDFNEVAPVAATRSQGHIMG